MGINCLKLAMSPAGRVAAWPADILTGAARQAALFAGEAHGDAEWIAVDSAARGLGLSTEKLLRGERVMDEGGKCFKIT